MKSWIIWVAIKATACTVAREPGTCTGYTEQDGGWEMLQDRKHEEKGRRD